MNFKSCVSAKSETHDSSVPKGKTMKASMSSGAKVTAQKGAEWTSYTIDNFGAVADALILR